MFLQLKVVPEITNVKIFQRIMDIIKIHVGIKLLLQMPDCICRIYISKRRLRISTTHYLLLTHAEKHYGKT